MSAFHNGLYVHVKEVSLFFYSIKKLVLDWGLHKLIVLSQIFHPHPPNTGNFPVFMIYEVYWEPRLLCVKDRAKDFTYKL